jgi:hypothetical protein
MYSLHKRGKFTCVYSGKESLPEGKSVKKALPLRGILGSPYGGEESQALSGGGVSKVTS